MQEVLQEILAQVRSAWRFRWWGVAVAWLVAPAGWAVVSLMPDIYEARTQIIVDTSSVLSPLLGNNIVESDVDSRLVQERQKLLSRANLETVAIANDLFVRANTDPERNIVLEELRNNVVISARSVNQQAGFNAPDSGLIFAISYQHMNPSTAVGVVNAFKDLLIEGTLAGGRQGAEVASTFLDDQSAENADLLREAQDARLTFQRANADRLPGAGGGIQQRIQNEKDELEQAKRYRRLAQSTRAELRAKLSGESPVAASSDTGNGREPAPGSLDARIRDARSDLDLLLQRYTEHYPPVHDAQKYLADLERQRAERLRELGIVDPDQELSRLEGNAVYEDIRIKLNDVDLELARHEADIQDREQRIADLQSQMQDVLAVEAELDQLNQTVKYYDDERIKLEDARKRQQLSTQVSSTEQPNFQVTDPPRAGAGPVAPQRLLLLARVFALALGSGGALCWLLAQVRPVFSSPRILREASGLPILGVVGLVTVSAAARARQRWSLMVFTGAVGCLAAVFVAAIAIEMVGPGLRAILGVA